MGVNMASHLYQLAREIYVPQIDNGTLHYNLMEIVVDENAGGVGAWGLSDRPVQAFPGSGDVTRRWKLLKQEGSRMASF
jgi:hypothetical protein